MLAKRLINQVWGRPAEPSANVQAPKPIGGHPSSVVAMIEEIKFIGRRRYPDVAIKLPRILRLDRQRRDRLRLEACQEVEKCVGHVNTRDGKSGQILSPSAQKPQAR